MEKRNTPALILYFDVADGRSIQCTAPGCAGSTATNLGSVTGGSAAVIPEAALVIRNTVTGAIDHARPADRRACGARLQSRISDGCQTRCYSYGE
jgi:hypothetical protein